MIIVKIIKNDTVYVQVKDLKRLKESNEIISNSLIFTLYILFNNYRNYKDDDFIALNKQDVSLKNINWILNFDEIINNNENDITTICNNLINKRNILADKYNSLSTKDRIKNRKMITKSKDLEYQIECYKDILEIIKGNKKISLPDGVEFPKGFIKKNKIKKLIHGLTK